MPQTQAIKKRRGGRKPHRKPHATSDRLSHHHRGGLARDQWLRDERRIEREERRSASRE